MLRIVVREYSAGFSRQSSANLCELGGVFCKLTVKIFNRKGRKVLLKTEDRRLKSALRPVKISAS
jgi:hypothetical protein